jgi:hypothetical protein
MPDPHPCAAPSQQPTEDPPRNPFTIRRWTSEAGFAIVILGLIWWPEEGGGDWRWHLLLTALYVAGRACWFWWDARRWRRWLARR